MAKVGHYEVYINGEHHKLPINCSSKGLFSTVYPQVVRGVTQYKEYHETKDALEREIRRVVNIAEMLQEQQKDIIRYNVISRSFPHQMSNATVYRSLVVEFVAIRVTTRGSSVNMKNIVPIRNYWERDNKTNDLPDGYTFDSATLWEQKIEHLKNEIPFTPEAYQFFADLQSKIEKMATDLAAFLTPETVQLTLDINYKLPGLINEGR